MFKSLNDIDAVKREVLRVVDREKPGGPNDLARSRSEIEALLASFSDFLPQWKELPSVFRVARLETDAGVLPFSDNIVLPNVKHELEIVVNMLNYLREQKGLEAVKMPLFLQPDEISLAIEEPGECHCDEERTVDARRRSARRLGRRGLKRWVRTQQKVLDRDDRKCRRCGAAKDLHVHRTETWHRDNDPGGYLTLCRRCHVVEGKRLAPSAAALRFHVDDPAALGGTAIRSQLALVFQKGALNWVGLVIGREYFVLKS